jgi:glycosyltransferase involved in cell wall biosynthesis
MTELITFPSDHPKALTSQKQAYPEIVIDSSLFAAPSISVVIPVRNVENCLSDCLDAIFSQSLAPTEVLVVDGGSTDRTIEIASQYPVRIIFEKHGPVGAARQLGVESSVGEYVAFTDGDCIPEKDWLKNLVNAFNGETIGVGGGIINVGNNFWENSVAYSRDTFLGSAESVQGRVFKEKRFVSSISGCNCIYLRQTLLNIGGFKSNLSMNEDTEINKRLTEKGKLVYIPNATIIHNQRRGLRAFAKQMVEYGRGRGKNRLFALQCVPPIVAPFLLLLAPFSGLLVPAAISLYLVALLAIGGKIAAKHKNIKYLASMPVVFLIEHYSYTFGFWKGLFEGLKR